MDVAADGVQRSLMASILLWMFGAALPPALGTELLIKPVNTAAFVDDRVTFYCKSSDGSDVDWSKCSPSASCTRISRGGVITIDDPERKYSVDNPSAGEFDLVISPATKDDACRYRCQPSAPFSTVEAFGELILLDRSLNCSVNDTLDGLVESGVLEVSCHQHFAGRWAPDIRCRFEANALGIAMADRSSSTTSFYQGIALAFLQLNGDQIVCDLAFLHPQPWEYLSADEASNKPNVSQYWESAELVITSDEYSVNEDDSNTAVVIGAVLGAVLALSVTLNIMLCFYIKRPRCAQPSCLSSRPKKYSSQDTTLDFSTVSSVSATVGIKPGPSMGNVAAYQYISDSDVTSGKLQPSAVRGQEDGSVNYEPFSFDSFSERNRQSLPPVPNGASSSRLDEGSRTQSGIWRPPSMTSVIARQSTIECGPPKHASSVGALNKPGNENLAAYGKLKQYNSVATMASCHLGDGNF